MDSNLLHKPMRRVPVKIIGYFIKLMSCTVPTLMAFMVSKVMGAGCAITTEVTASSGATRTEMAPPRQYLTRGSNKCRRGGRSGQPNNTNALIIVFSLDFGQELEGNRILGQQGKVRKAM